MYTNPSNIIDAYINLLKVNEQDIKDVCTYYNPKSPTVTVFKGFRKSVPDSNFPCLEVEPTTSTNRWATTRGQRPRFQFIWKLTTITQDVDLHLEYISTLATRLVQIMTTPEVLQMELPKETQWTHQGGVSKSFILDSLIEDVTYNANQEGTIRVAEFSMFAEVHETMAEAKYLVPFDGTTPLTYKPVILGGN